MSQSHDFATDSLDTPTIVDAIEEVNEVLVDGIYANWIGVFRAGKLLGFLVSNGVGFTFRLVDESMSVWWSERTEMDDEN